ncbi:MAG: ArnT family glycosyltransferase [Flavobacteriales bacterium]|jgi:4-amino-4-deoxy-L-arabinose transferase-like glycosyltransferase
MNLKTLGIVFGISLLLFIPFLGKVHLFDWDEINFAECAREMVTSGKYSTVTIDYLPFWEKPPLFIWMQALSMKIFGINEFAARFPNVVAALFTILTLIYHGAQHQNRKFGYWWATFYIGSFLPNMYFHSGIIDPWFNLFIFNSIAFYYLGTSKQRIPEFLFAGLFTGLAVMTKGPVAILLIASSVFLFHLITKFKSFPKFKYVVLTLITALVISLLWFFLLWISGNKAIITQFLDYQVRLFQTKDAGHGGPIYYHWLVLLLGCFPASFFALGSFFRKDSYQNPFNTMLFISGLFTLVLFSIVQTKIIHYSSFCYFFLTYFAAITVSKSEKANRISTWITLAYLALLALGIGVLVYIQVYGNGIASYLTIKDPFALANLQAAEPWNTIDFLPALIWLSAIAVGIYFMLTERLKQAILTLLVAVPIGILSIQATILPHIEQYTQRAAISFYESKAKQNVYLIPLGFKSYAHLFYGQVKPHHNKNRFNEAWICSDSTDLPVYYVARIPMHENYLKAYPNLKKLTMKNGFVFLTQKKNLSLNSKVK